MSLSVCLSVCPLAYLENHMSKLRQFLCMCTLIFSDGVAICYVLPVCGWRYVFTQWPYGALCIPKRRYNTQSALHIAAEILTRFCSTIKTGSAHCELYTGDEICYQSLPCYYWSVKKEWFTLKNYVMMLFQRFRIWFLIRRTGQQSIRRLAERQVHTNTRTPCIILCIITSHCSF